VSPLLQEYTEEMKLKGKVAIVTGASRGIGQATARALCNGGAKVALVARSKDKLQELAGELHDSIAIPADMTKPEQIRSMIQSVSDHFGQVDILINNAGQGYDAPIEHINPKTLSAIFDLDLIGPLIAMQQVIPIMRIQGAGSIINVSSGTALMHLPNMGGYAAIKAALAHLSLSAREELKPHHIIVSVAYPYITATDFEKNTIKEELAWPESQTSSGYKPPKADSVEYVADMIVRCLKTGEAEIFAHDWMKRAA